VKRLVEKDNPSQDCRDGYTIVDLFLRQYLNNGCDGFGFRNVTEMYKYFLSIKADLIRLKLFSNTARNRSGFVIWTNYEIEVKEQKALKKICCICMKKRFKNGNICKHCGRVWCSKCEDKGDGDYETHGFDDNLNLSLIVCKKCQNDVPNWWVRPGLIYS